MLDAPPVQGNHLLYKETLALQENVHWWKQSVSRKSYPQQLNLHTGADHTNVIADLLPLGTEYSIHVTPALQYCQLPWVEKMPFWLLFIQVRQKDVLCWTWRPSQILNFFFTHCVFSLWNSSWKTHEELLSKISDWIIKSWRLINRLGHTGWKYQEVPNRSSVEHRVVKSTFICDRLCTEENEMFLLVWMAVNLHSNSEFWGCTWMSAQDLTSLLNMLIFSAKLQPTRVNTLPSKAYLSSQHVHLIVY